MISIGERLREERLRRGLGVEQIAEQLKINPSMLVAIETGDLDRLPGGFFRRSFVRQYARALGVPDDEIEAELKRIDGDEAANAVNQGEPAFRPQIDRGPVTVARSHTRLGGPQPLGALIAFLLIVAACSAIYALWERTRQAETAPVGISQPARTASESRLPEQTPPAPVEATPLAAAPTQGQAEPTGVPSSTEPSTPATAAPQQAPVSGAPVRLELSAATEVWVRIREDGQLLFQGTINAGETRRFEGQKAVVARIGRPGSVTINWNGKPTGPLRPADSPITLEFTPETYRIVPPQPAEQPPPADAP
ncbi:MAG TPA: RodZ domain-containing protein [Bryobacteraceae bacterium]|nr:RodZ domain-containing protein [Bryobacteraceae bacterium]